MRAPHRERFLFALAVASTIAAGAALSFRVTDRRAAMSVSDVVVRSTGRDSNIFAIVGRDTQDLQSTVILFADWQCPYSRAAFRALLRYKSSSIPELRVVIHQLPLSPESGRAAAAFVCAEGRGEQAQLIERLDDVRRIGLDEVIHQFLQHLPAERQGRFGRCLGAESTLLAVRNDSALGARIGASVTPTILFAGARMDGYPGHDFTRILDSLGNVR